MTLLIPSSFGPSRRSSAFKQGYEPKRPERAAMANAAMKFLADGDAKLEVRSEAARALGLMQIPTSVRKYNYPLVAHSVGLLAADLGTQINALIPEHTVKSAAAAKAAIAPDAAKASSKSPAGKLAPKGKAAADAALAKGAAAADLSAASDQPDQGPILHHALDRPGLSGV